MRGVFLTSFDDQKEPCSSFMRSKWQWTCGAQLRVAHNFFAKMFLKRAMLGFLMMSLQNMPGLVASPCLDRFSVHELAY